MPLIRARKPNYSIPKKQSGFSLIEVMVTAVILSSSMLGIAQLQATAMKNTHDSHFRTTANTLAYEIVDRMRANRTISSTTTNYDIDIGDDVSASNCESGTCSPAQMAVYDIEAWKYLLDANLPNGDGAIDVTVGTTGAEITVTVQWQDNDSDGERNTYSLNISTLL